MKKKSFQTALILVVVIPLLLMNCSLPDTTADNIENNAKSVDNESQIEVLSEEIIYVDNQDPALGSRSIRSGNVTCQMKIYLQKVKFYRDLDAGSRGDAYFKWGLNSKNLFHRNGRYPGSGTKQVHKGNTYTWNALLIDRGHTLNPYEWDPKELVYTFTLKGWDKDRGRDDYYGGMSFNFDPFGVYVANNGTISGVAKNLAITSRHIKMWVRLEGTFYK